MNGTGSLIDCDCLSLFCSSHPESEEPLLLFFYPPVTGFIRSDIHHCCIGTRRKGLADIYSVQFGPHLPDLRHRLSPEWLFLLHVLLSSTM